MKIKLTKNKQAIIDEEDATLLSKYSWHSHSQGYASTKVKGEVVLMHRLIMGAKKSQEIDHINRNKLDNRRANLRFCTHSQNMLNRAYSFISKGGVSLHANGKWHARIQKAGKRTSLGLYPSKELAVLALEDYRQWQN